MLEKMFTTKMSMDKKKLQNRFSKIRSKNGKTSKFIALAVFAVIIVSIICVSIWVAVSRQDDMILYENEAMNFKLEIPLSWQGKYIVDESAIDDGYIAFKHKRIAEKHDGMGTLFSVIKLPDSEIDEYMNMVGNMTVVWRNQDYGYLIGRPTDVQVPIFAGNDEEDIKLAEEYQKMYKEVSNIETTFSLINDVGTPNIANAENMSYAQIRELQRQVNNGHFPWRIDYKQVMQMYLSGMGESVENGKMTYFAGDGEGCTGTYNVGDKSYTLELFKPIDKSENGIWIVKSVKELGGNILKEISFSEASPAGAWIEKQEDGWYRVSQTIYAHFHWFEVGKEPYPTSVTAYFTPTGTEMDVQKKEVGKIAAPYTYRTSAKVLSMQLKFPKDATIGHLWFAFNFEDGSSEISDTFNVIMGSYAGDGKAELFKYDKYFEIVDVSFGEAPDVVKTYDATPEDKISEYIKNGELCYSSTHYEMSDGTWKVKEHPYTYKYRLELTGRLHNAVKDSTYIILSNRNDITFEQAWKASGLSSNTEDYFDAKDAIIIGRK